MLVRVGNSWDITNLINSKTYEMNEEREFEEWKDGNNRKHRIYKDGKVSGSFEVALLTTTLQAFLEGWYENAINDVVSLSVYVKNTGEMKSINAFFSLTGNKHIKRNDDNTKYLDTIIIEIEEQ